MDSASSVATKRQLSVTIFPECILLDKIPVAIFCILLFCILCVDIFGVFNPNIHVLVFLKSSTGFASVKNSGIEKQFNFLHVPTGTVDRITTGTISKSIIFFIAPTTDSIIPK